MLKWKEFRFNFVSFGWLFSKKARKLEKFKFVAVEKLGERWLAGMASSVQAYVALPCQDQPCEDHQDEDHQDEDQLCVDHQDGCGGPSVAALYKKRKILM